MPEPILLFAIVILIFFEIGQYFAIDSGPISSKRANFKASITKLIRRESRFNLYPFVMIAIIKLSLKGTKICM